jgi:hypothetical protein
MVTIYNVQHARVENHRVVSLQSKKNHQRIHNTNVTSSPLFENNHIASLILGEAVGFPAKFAPRRKFRGLGVVTMRAADRRNGGARPPRLGVMSIKLSTNEELGENVCTALSGLKSLKTAYVSERGGESRDTVRSGEVELVVFMAAKMSTSSNRRGSRNDRA